MNANEWNPCVEVADSHGTRSVSLMTYNLMKRRIFLTGPITDATANSFVQQILYLTSESNEPIDIIINSGGGSVNAGLLIYDTIQAVKCPVNMYCTGLAASMAAIILAGGQKGRRFILPLSQTMIHEPLIGDGVGGSASSIHNIAESIMEVRRITNGILAKHTGKPIEEINRATAYDHYMNSKESIEFGLCDSVKNFVA